MELPPPPTLIAPRARVAAAARRRPPDPSAQAVLDRGQERGHLPRRARLQRDPGQPADVRGARGDRHRGNRARHQGPRTSGATSGAWRPSTRTALEGAFSRVSLFQVVEPEAPQPVATPTPAPAASAPTLVVQAVDEVSPGIVHVGGRASRGATVTVNGTPVKVLPDGSFSEFVRHGGPGEVRRARHGRGRPVRRAVARRLEALDGARALVLRAGQPDGGGLSCSTSSSSRCWARPSRAPCSSGARASRDWTRAEDVPEVERRLAPFLARKAAEEAAKRGPGARARRRAQARPVRVEEAKPGSPALVYGGIAAGVAALALLAWLFWPRAEPPAPRRRRCRSAARPRTIHRRS